LIFFGAKNLCIGPLNTILDQEKELFEGKLLVPNKTLKTIEARSTVAAS
jgi:hypothetical protein